MTQWSEDFAEFMHSWYRVVILSIVGLGLASEYEPVWSWIERHTPQADLVIGYFFVLVLPTIMSWVNYRQGKRIQRLEDQNAWLNAQVRKLRDIDRFLERATSSLPVSSVASSPRSLRSVPPPRRTSPPA